MSRLLTKCLNESVPIQNKIMKPVSIFLKDRFVKKQHPLYLQDLALYNFLVS